MVSKQKIVLFIAAAIVGQIYSVQPAHAHEGHDHNDIGSVAKDVTKQVSQLNTDVKTEAEKRIDTIRQQALEKNIKLKDQTQQRVAEPRAEARDQTLRNGALTACKNRQNHINMTMDSIIKRNQQRYDKITAIYDKATAYYAKSGRNVENYTALIAAVEAQKQAVQNGLATIKPVGGFDCTTTAPRQSIRDFKYNRQANVNNMAAYKDSVKALIEAIKSSPKAVH